MRGAVSINLASDPFRRDRPFVVAAIAGCVALGGLLAYQVALGWIERDQRSELNGSIEMTERQLAALGQEEARVTATLRRPENSDAIDYAVFLNGLILRKAISWTKIFNDLERVMPHNVRLISVRPQLNLDNQILLDMQVGCQTPEPVIGMLTNLESSALFGAPALSSWNPPSQSDPLYRYRVSVNYAPQL